ncbi:L-rhamnose mutarotase [Olivibacter sp. CPCC 100613]|uniref:L-rhamnose mutarotase n=1 Tax=Olivibacter sp. CPCC 100613 TaxID=3079931 RepID=UPI002FFA9FE3
MKHIVYGLVWILLSSACTPFKTHDKSSNQLVQLVVDDEDDLSADLLADIRKTSEGETNLYQWKNRLLFYGAKKEADRFYQRCKTQFPKGTITRTSTPFYAFDRARCADGEKMEQASDHIVLSANLVADSAMQKAYLSYHHRQFEEWPEVSEGFCRAEFQQVLLYKIGRQLLLVIDIPKGADFEALNKRTVENNPRVDKWNHLMAAYQEGLPDTKAGEVWVRFEVMNVE